ncbi:response regulator [Asanoa sp. NPDC049518]|uniref:response regulator n=1 Tax=unclassified Asanoa TaxID=2685164 RepID=UPI00343FFCF2
MVSAQPVLHVLVVEDDLGDLALVENAFAEQGVASSLHHVADGVDALAFLRRENGYADAPRPDLILLDLNMPRVDGRQVLEQIKQDEDLRSIPAIVFTTSAATPDIVSSYRSHANAYVTKPIDLDEFDRVVAEIRDFFGRTASLPRTASS